MTSVQSFSAEITPPWYHNTAPPPATHTHTHTALRKEKFGSENHSVNAVYGQMDISFFIYSTIRNAAHLILYIFLLQMFFEQSVHVGLNIIGPTIITLG